MKRIYLSVLKRVEYPTRVGYGDNGRVFVLDWDSKSFVVDPIMIYDVRKPDNPLTRSHGARGICFHHGKLYVAGGEGLISIINPDTYEIEKTLTYPFRRTHQLKEHAGLLYVLSTGSDSYYKLFGEEVLEQIQLVPHDHDGKIESTLHFNSIGWSPSGEEYHLYFTPGTLINYTRGEVVANDLVGAHDVCFLDSDSIVVNNSGERTTLLLRKGTRKVIYRAPEPSSNIKFTGEKAKDNHAIWGYTRVAMLPPKRNLLFVGSLPATLTTLHPEYFSIIESYSFSDDPGESIYDIAFDPRDWS